MTIQIDGTIKDALMYHCPSGKRYLTGYIFGDRKGRFRDNEFIRTSRVLEELEPGIWKTYYSTYAVEFADEPEALH